MYDQDIHFLLYYKTYMRICNIQQKTYISKQGKLCRNALQFILLIAKIDLLGCIPQLCISWSGLLLRSSLPTGMKTRTFKSIKKLFAILLQYQIFFSTVNTLSLFSTQQNIKGSNLSFCFVCFRIAAI